MLVEKISNKQIVFSFSLELNGLVLQRLIDYAKYLEATAELKAREYAKYLEATAGSTAKQEDIDALANEVSIEWWNKNKHRFLQ